MKGYFGQLARRTGLSIGNQAATAGRSSTEQAVAAGPKSSPLVAPIHVEEVVFTASSPVVDAEVPTRKTAGSSRENQPQTVATSTQAFASPRETANVVTDQNASGRHAETFHHAAETPDTTFTNETVPPQSHTRFVASEPETATPTTEQVFFDEQPFNQSERSLRSKEEPSSLTEQTVTLESSAKRLQQPDQETRDLSARSHEVQSVELVDSPAPKPGNANVPDAPDREPRRIFQEQLKEVIAWISSPPEEVKEPTLEVIEAEHDASNVVVREREQKSPVDRSTNNNEPHVNDLSLSIGTISIVVEEPKHDFPVSITPAPTTHTSPQPVAPEPTRLSRYYLRNL